MASAVVLARLLTPQDYGLIGMVAIIYGFVSMFQYMGLSTATIQWPQLSHAQVSTLFWINIGLSGSIAALTAASSPVLAWFYGEPRLIGITIAYAGAVFLAGLLIQHEALLSRQMRFSVISAIELTALLVGIFAAVLAALKGLAYWALVINHLAMTLTNVIGTWIACRWRPGMPRKGTGVRKMISFGGNVTGYNILSYFARNVDNLLIGKFWGPYQLGLYAKAYQMLLIPVQQINGPVSAVAGPALSRLTDTPERYRAAFLKLLEKVAMISMPGAVFMIVTADWLVLLLLGPQWEDASRIFMLLGTAVFIQPTAKTLLLLFITQGRAADLLNWGVVGAIIAIISIAAGLPWGAVGVAACYAMIDLCVGTPLLFWLAGRKGPVRPNDLYRAIAPAVCGSVSALVVLFIARRWLEPLTPITRLAVAFSMTAATSVLVFGALPAGRLAMRHCVETILFLIKRTKSESLS